MSMNNRKIFRLRRRLLPSFKDERRRMNMAVDRKVICMYIESFDRLALSTFSAVIILLYYHMMYFIVDIGSDPYMGVIYMAVLEVLITAAAWWVVRTFRRKPVYFWSYILAIFSGMCLIFPSEGKTDLLFFV